MKKITKSLLAAGVVAFSAMAQAAPVLTWQVEVIGSWTGYAPNPGVTLSGTTLSWGTPTTSGQSSLSINNPAVTSVDTYLGGVRLPRRSSPPAWR